jgi:two-component system, OmpR family, alkaline phosphatase synthesis response regulator PhoP
MMSEDKAKILIVDDEVDIVDFLAYNLKKYGFEIFTANSGEECLQKLVKEIPDLILLDIMMPGISGIQTCKRLKKNIKTKDIPVIMLTAKTTEADIVTGLNSGADDYIVKPFSLNILFARIKAQLRRVVIQGEVIKIGNLELDLDSRVVKVNGKEIELTYSRFEMLLLFVKNLGKAFSRKDIVTAVKGDDYPVTERAIDVHIVEMRKMLGEYGKCIKTVRGVGYKFAYDLDDK